MSVNNQTPYKLVRIPMPNIATADELSKYPDFMREQLPLPVVGLIYLNSSVLYGDDGLSIEGRREEYISAFIETAGKVNRANNSKFTIGMDFVHDIFNLFDRFFEVRPNIKRILHGACKNYHVISCKTYIGSNPEMELKLVEKEPDNGPDLCYIASVRRPTEIVKV